MDYIGITLNILLGLLSGMIISPIAVKLAKKFGLIDDPISSPRKIHDKPTPCAGGLVILLGLLLGIITRISHFDLDVLKIILAGCVVFLTGIIDDHKSISVFQKFSGQFIATTILILLGIRVRMFESLLLSFQIPHTMTMFLDILVTYIWVIGLTNAFNFIDSMDGLLAQLTEIQLFFIGLSGIIFGQINIVMLAVFLLGLMIAISVFNSHPAIYFLGDSGALFLGFIFASLSILLRPINLPQISSWFFPITLFSVPLFDMFLVVASRIRHKTKFYKAGTDHTYHRLCRIGLSNYRAIEVMKLESFFWGFVGLVAIFQTPTLSNILFGLFLLNYIGSYFYLDSLKNEKKANNSTIFYEP